MLVSRVLVFGAGVLSSQTVARVPGWEAFDPLRLSAGLGSVGNALAATSVRWDAIHYLNIAQHGYLGAGDTVFFPLYPALTAGAGWLVGSDVWGAIVVSFVAFAIGLLLLHRLTEIELDRGAANATVLLLAFAPLSLFFTAVYTESLFLALSVGAVLAARRERWIIASILSALATVTRVPGILVTVPVAWMFFRSPSRSWRGGPWLLLSPAALLGFLIYLSRRGFGFLAPLTNQIGHQHLHELSGPIATMGYAVSAAWTGIRQTFQGVAPFSPTNIGPFSVRFESIILLAWLILAVVVLVMVFRRLPFVYGVYALLTLIVTIYSAVSFQPLQGLDRYWLTIFPLWMAAGAWVARHPSRYLLLLVSAGVLCFYSFEFATWTFLG